MAKKDLSHNRGWLEEEAAESLARLDKLKGKPVDVNSAGRTREEQQKLWDLFYYPSGKVRPKNTRPSWLYYPAKPGTSNHETGLAIDTDDQTWMNKNAKEHGWTQMHPKTDPVHYEYDKSKDKHAKAKQPAKVESKESTYPKVTVARIEKIGDVRGLQYIARQYGYHGPIDNIWGPNSQKGFTRFLKAQYSGSILSWLRKRWGYVGDDRLGPVMKKALQKANAENLKANR